MKIPYIGITDVPSGKEARYLLKVLREEKTVGNFPHQLMVGAMMSYKTLHGLPTKWARIFPAYQDLADIFVDDPLAFNTLHYADYEGIDVAASLLDAIHWGGKNLRALQLDMVWPKASAIAEVRLQHPKLKYILQINKKSLDEIKNDMNKLVGELHRYQNTFDYVLFDCSMGEGKPMNVSDMYHFVSTARRYRPELGIAIAGGLGPNTVSILAPIIGDFPNTSWDAQGQIHPNNDPNIPISSRLAEEYLRKSALLARRYHRKR
ncbi:MAG: hypothetical protein WC725_01415 [Patescibacteria group bacterium]|jgi:hypothetical protein